MPDQLRTNGDKLSFLIAEFKHQREDIGELKEDISMFKERLFVKRNGKRSLEAEVDHTAETLRDHLDCVGELEKSNSVKKFNIFLAIMVSVLTLITGVLTYLITAHI